MNAGGIAHTRTSQQWSALVEYDPSRTGLPSESSSSVGKDVGQILLRPRSSTEAECSTRRPLQPVDSSASKPIGDGTLCDPAEVPEVLKGSNAVLVNREMDRLRYKGVKEVQRRWRIITGFAMLLVLMPSTYILAQYIRTYLTLSPSNWPLSKAANGSIVSSDPVMRSLALSGACLSLMAVFLAVGSGLYLRLTRRRSNARWFTLMPATITCFLCLALSVTNLALIAIWHNTYTATPASPYAHMRDVARRCRGNWSLDLLWDAASQQKTELACQHDSANTLEAYYIAGATRLLFFVIVCAIWLQCIARYHHALNQVASSNESIVESAEMEKLLLEEDFRTSHPLDATEQAEPPYHLPLYTTEQEETTPLRRDVRAPSLDRFSWQRMRTEASGVSIEKEEIPAKSHQKEVSASGWSTGLMSQVWTLVKGNTDELSIATKRDSSDIAKCHIGHSNEALHEKQVSKLGVRGWFNRESSGLSAEEVDLDENENEQLLYATQHSRMSSQEKRAKECRHAASSRSTLLDEEQTDLLKRERQKRDQLDRIAYLASMGYNITAHTLPQAPIQEEADPVRRSSSSAGDELPHMPELTNPRAYNAQDGIDDDDDDIYWRVTGLDPPLADDEYVYSARKENLYVRTLGKLVRKMSDIKSVGSQERIDRRSRSNGQGGSA